MDKTIKNDTDWYHVVIGIVKKYKKHIKVNWTENKMTILEVSAKDLMHKLSAEDLKRIFNYGWYVENDKFNKDF